MIGFLGTFAAALIILGWWGLLLWCAAITLIGLWDLLFGGRYSLTGITIGRRNTP